MTHYHNGATARDVNHTACSTTCSSRSRLSDPRADGLFGLIVDGINAGQSMVNMVAHTVDNVNHGLRAAAQVAEAATRNR